MTRWLALLYSVVLSPTRRVTSQDLINLAMNIGVIPVKTVVSTGNLIFIANDSETDLTTMFEAAIIQNWRRAIPVLLRSESDWRTLVSVNPFPDYTARDPAKVAVRVMRQDPDPAALAKMTQVSSADDYFAMTSRAVWLASEHQLSKSPLLRALSSPKIGTGTWRNASAITKIAKAFD